MVVNVGKDTTLKARIGWQGLTTSEYRDVGEYLLVTGTDFKGGFVDWDSCYFVDKIRYEQDRNIQLKNGDVVITKDGTIGKVGYINNLKLPATLNSGVFVIRPKKGKSIDTKYLYYVFTSKIFDEFLSKLTAGSTISHLYQKDFVNFEFTAPTDINEQKEIAKVLSDTDELINSLQILIEKKESIKTATMQQLLTGKKRLKGFVEEWDEKTLGSITSIKTGKRNNQDKIINGIYPFFVRSQKIERINTYSYEGEAILIPGEGGIGLIYHYIEGKFDYHQRVYKISDFEKNIYGKFVYYLMKQNFYDHAIKNSVKATVDSLRLPTLQKFVLRIPPTKKEQKKIVNILVDMDNEIEKLKEKLKKTKLIKEAMMDELLTGKTRLI